MAVYTYRCKVCENAIEVEAPMTDGPHKPSCCPHCMALAASIVRVWDSPAIEFVGGGWGCKS